MPREREERKERVRKEEQERRAPTPGPQLERKPPPEVGGPERRKPPERVMKTRPEDVKVQRRFVKEKDESAFKPERPAELPVRKMPEPKVIIRKPAPRQEPGPQQKPQQQQKQEPQKKEKGKGKRERD